VGFNVSDGPCQFCGKENACLVLYICWFETVWHEVITKDIFFSKTGVIVVQDKVPNQYVGSSANIVNLTTGKVMKQCYKRKLPEWTTDPLKRSVAVASGHFPASFKPSKRRLSSLRKSQP